MLIPFKGQGFLPLLCLFLITALLPQAPIPAAAADLKVGHFDLQRLIAQSDAGREAREQYLGRAKKYQEELNRRGEHLKKLKEEIEKETKQLREEEKPSAQFLARNKEYAAQFREFQRLQGGYQDELKVYDAEMTRKLLDELAPVLADYARRHHFDYLFRLGEPLAFAEEKHDVTDELVKAFNEKRKGRP